MSEDRRFVDIVSRGPRTSGYGSGFLLGEGLVLTARHVLMPADADFALGEVTVRNVDMVKHGEARVPAKLVWPDDPALLKVHKPDIALIRVADHPSFPHRWPLIRIHGLGDDDREWPMVFNYEVHAVGFPEFAIMQGRPPTERDTRQLSGRTRNGDGQVRGQFLIVDAAFSDPANAQNRRWSGFSGSALFAASRGEDAVTELLGVVTDQRFDEFQFSAHRIAPLFDDPVIRQLLAGMAAPATSGGAPSEVVEVPHLDSLVCLVDRKDQEDELVLSYRDCCGPAAAGDKPEAVPRPLIAILPGAGQGVGHAADEMVNRLIGHTLRKELSWPGHLIGGKRLRWRESQPTIEANLRSMRADLWNNIRQTREPEPSHPDQFVAGWDRYKPGRFYYSELEQFRDNAMSRGVLAGWAALWGSQRPADGLVPLHLLLVNADEAHCRVWIEDAASEGAEMILLPELQACSTGHLDDWLNNHAPHHVAPAHRPFLRRMGVSLTREYSREFLLRDFRNRVKQLVTEEFDGFNR